MRYVGIDISTHTGFVVLDQKGEIITAEEITAEGKDPERMMNIIGDVVSALQKQDVICIEDFAYAQANRMALIGGLGWGVRMELFRLGIKYTLISTGQLKQFTGAKGNGNKINVAVHVNKRWGFEPIGNNDNITDAYVLAQMARAIKGHEVMTEFQQKIIKKVTA
jgi:crossover junction endodeoxyribonuclease RuvC